MRNKPSLYMLRRSQEFGSCPPRKLGMSLAVFLAFCLPRTVTPADLSRVCLLYTSDAADD